MMDLGGYNKLFGNTSSRGGYNPYGAGAYQAGGASGMMPMYQGGGYTGGYNPYSSGIGGNYMSPTGQWGQGGMDEFLKSLYSRRGLPGTISGLGNNPSGGLRQTSSTDPSGYGYGYYSENSRPLVKTDGTSGGGGTGSTGAPGNTGWSTGQGMVSGNDVSQYFPEYGTQPEFPFSPDLLLASDVLGGMAQTGWETEAPGQWGTATDIASQMGATGMPTSTSEGYQAAKRVTEEDTRQAINQAAEQARLKGLRWSTPLAQQAQTIAGRNMANLGAQWTQQEMGAQEAARQRQLQGAEQLRSLGTGYAGLGEAASNRALSAAGMLPQTAAMYTNLPLSVAQTMYGMGQGNQTYYNQMYNAYQAEQQRLMEENNPWLRYASGVSQLPFQSQPQMYQPSLMSQLLGAGTYIAGAYAGAPRSG